ncbi:MAG: hypothetical protein LRY43_03760 [Gammaproteobacteria bacterium]|nr:hypothetical protein [Gammaproteobacteria bacterium]
MNSWYNGQKIIIRLSVICNLIYSIFFYDTVQRDPKEAFAEKEEVFVYTFTPGQRSPFDQTTFQEKDTAIDFTRVKFTPKSLSLAPFLSDELRNILQNNRVLNTPGEEKQTENLALSKLFKCYMNTQTGGLLNDTHGFSTIFHDILHNGFIIGNSHHSIDGSVWADINLATSNTINIHSFLIQSQFLFQTLYIKSREGASLCLMSECPETGPPRNKLYLGIEESCVKYRTTLTNNDSITLSGDIGAQGGELYQAIQEKKIGRIERAMQGQPFDIILKTVISPNGFLTKNFIRTQRISLRLTMRIKIFRSIIFCTPPLE